MESEGRAAKRRRIDKSLHKPFKSPLMPTSNSSLNRPGSATARPSSAKADEEQLKTPRSAPKSQESHLLTPSSDPQSKPTQAANVPQRTHRRPVASSTTKSNRATESAVVSARREVEHLRQALKILTSTKDDELEGLTIKWRGAARLAAEELYSVARDRVNRMGGVESLRDREREAKERKIEWEREDRQFEYEKRVKEVKKLVEEGTLAEEDLKRLEEDNMNAEKDREVEQEEYSSEREEPEKAEGGYTMGTFLRGLKVDLELIGYSPSLQAWVG
ncbi:hypothetical protein BT63DRAFT_479934 [Microthyrium microscopicum]|uniref:Uncharacterized protein n=1 Tax=Microthyrium microscopicum TaxID=703497 RepID=A0A6A6UA99_9PEZI|nr:hypothetical protein BT63DRAFT_479934 [Microthyrium microscopicum]